jgi:hypothetical protein
MQRVVPILVAGVCEQGVRPGDYSPFIVDAGLGIVTRPGTLDTKAVHIRDRLPVVERLVNANGSAKSFALSGSLLGSKSLEDKDIAVQVRRIDICAMRQFGFGRVNRLISEADQQSNFVVAALDLSHGRAAVFVEFPLLIELVWRNVDQRIRHLAAPAFDHPGSLVVASRKVNGLASDGISWPALRSKLRSLQFG